MKKIKIKASSNEYDITIGHRIRFEINELINDSYSSIMIITDEVIENLYLNDIKDTLNFDNITTYILPSGEAEKSINNYYKIHTRAIEAGLDRNSLIIALGRSEEHTSELQSRGHLVCRLLLEKKNIS